MGSANETAAGYDWYSGISRTMNEATERERMDNGMVVYRRLLG